LGGFGRDANVKRSASIAWPNDCDTTNAEAEGDRDAAFSTAKGSANAANDRKQQFPSWQKAS